MMELEQASLLTPARWISQKQAVGGDFMLVILATEDCLQRGAVMKLTERFNVACSAVYRLWEHAAHMCAMGIINTPELTSQKKIPGEHLSI